MATNNDPKRKLYVSNPRNRVRVTKREVAAANATTPVTPPLKVTLEAAEVAPPTPPPPAPRPTAQRGNNGGGFSLNIWGVVTVIVIAIIAFNFFQNGSSAPAASPDEEVAGSVATQDTRDEEFFCPRVMGLREGRELWLNVSVPLQNNAGVNSSAIRGTMVVSSDVLTATGESACDEENIWLEVEMTISANRVRTGWVQIADEQDSWYVWVNQEPAPAPIATEEASAPQNGEGQSMRTVRLGEGTCVPRLNPADFFDADEIVDGQDVSPDWSGYWVRSTESRRDVPVNVRPTPSTQYGAIAQFGWFEGRAEAVEVIATSSGFQFACGDGLVWWNVRHHHINGTVVSGWVAETPRNSTELMIEGF